MDFTLDDELAVLRDATRRFTDEEIIPVAAEYDRSGEFPRAIIKKAWEVGLVSTCVPEEYGGVDLSVQGACVASEEIARGCAGFATSIMCNDLALTPILVGGNDAQKKEWMGLCASEFKLGSFCLSEPAAGSDVAGLQPQATKEGEE